MAGGFCARMASQFGMKPVKAAGGKPAYEACALKGLGVALFGGSTMVSVALKPPASGPIGDPARFGDACGVAAKRVACAVTGPAVFEMAVGAQTTPLEACDGETAEASMAKNRIRYEER
ncbi:hypothetical protein F1C10_15155 [Sphingomonas sp. NBWT7]|uniref:hypothetical protein n=1 Tax=Sphingomonas sp. NBWT7 TaxID=2596913 RepID=UPI001627ACD3|nr:hypothetical protein [Sphingomonas sp. NBWT7]QNE33122.1 hypothetical protein F1C10_15155 [Sphingomonas sp. NBWT7]